ncbi:MULTISPECIES: S1 family peptidase [unclassified Mycobacterium]|uniref:S1 family peptidase n=1 Tax=unclassified Mycobacterium TaxID=2642494 RepID=UPI000800603A|nr:MULTISPECIES: S1 family peptidase [unclassified Mycobacterium]OBG70716.1 endopeptidase [Mycobacterium sp. E1214]OBH22225.1 endopeptidase [Mycobacterium sp. E1319]
MVGDGVLELASWGLRYSPTGTIAFPLSAIALVVAALLPLLPKRRKRYRGLQRGASAATSASPEPRARSRMHNSLLKVAAVCSAVALVATFCLLPDSVNQAQEITPAPVLAPIDLPVASAVGPGAGIYVDFADGSGGMGCTAGFLVRTSTGQAGILTAGHCNRPGEMSRVTMNLDGVLPYATLGTFSRTVSEGVHDEQHDIGLVTLDGDNVPQTSAVAASLPVSGVASGLQLGQQLCKFGMSSGADACGKIVQLTGSKVVFLATGQCGDSGGPVYVNQADGTASAVGILIRGGDPDTPRIGCAAPAKFSVAELVRPWLDRWHLSVVTAPAAHG